MLCAHILGMAIQHRSYKPHLKSHNQSETAGFGCDNKAQSSILNFDFLDRPMRTDRILGMGFNAPLQIQSHNSPL